MVEEFHQIAAVRGLIGLLCKADSTGIELFWVCEKNSAGNNAGWSPPNCTVDQFGGMGSCMVLMKHIDGGDSDDNWLRWQKKTEAVAMRNWTLSADAYGFWAK